MLVRGQQVRPCLAVTFTAIVTDLAHRMSRGIRMVPLTRDVVATQAAGLRPGEGGPEGLGAQFGCRSSSQKFNWGPCPPAWDRSSWDPP